MNEKSQNCEQPVFIKKQVVGLTNIGLLVIVMAKSKFVMNAGKS